ncbi:transcription factor PHYTOCHROME INTERACTING FACTOR-LIKE 13-like isoform X2 [Primulina tabacum]|uniref:transcription factor PHYTOCHROME INTERACTING FACTOR-LIKE 13-like isoform X2 n=1 Tax=Primulina tabacum TaxID=48773 RepID=UPI003F5997FE
MDAIYLPDWKTDVEGQFPEPNQRRQLGLDNGLVELLWQNGEVVLHSQTCRKRNHDPMKSKQVNENDQTMSPVVGNLVTNLIQDDETISWIHCPIDEAFEKEFCSDFMSENPASTAVQANKPSGSMEFEKPFKFSVSDVTHVHQTSQPPTFAPPPIFETFESALQDQRSGHVRRTDNLDFPGSSHCGSNQLASSCGIGRRTVSPGVNENHTRNVSPRSDNGERETHDQTISSSYGGSGSSFWKTGKQSNDTNRHKRSRIVTGFEFPSDATEFESASGNKSSQNTGTNRRSRVAEVHNLSERRRRDKINEKMKALQDLIPHSNKSDKASMLDEAIEYMKSLQSQIQLMWMGSGMAPMVLPGMQQFMPRMGLGIGPTTIPTVPNLMQLSRISLVDQAMAINPATNQATAGLRQVLNPVNYQNQMQNPGFAEQYANYMALCSMQNISQPMNIFGFSSHSSQQNHHASAPPGSGNGSVP